MVAVPSTVSPDLGDITFKWSRRLLTISLWSSCLLFGVYIVAFYFGAYLTDDMTRWNVVLPDLYRPGEPQGSFAMAAHFLCGAMILMLGAVQLMSGVRKRWPRVHHNLGRIYIGASIVTAVGGLGYIAFVGTIGGFVMDVGFGLYGALMLLAGVQTLRYARARQIDQHHLWAWRLFALAIASWLYRMEYGLWLGLFGAQGHTVTFDGPLDQVMAFFFYVPNLLIVEILYRARNKTLNAPVRVLASSSLVVTALIVAFATYQFARRIWVPGIGMA